MQTLFGWSGPQTSAVGLALDLVGVALLTWDLFPEFRLTRERRFFQSRSKNLARVLLAPIQNEIEILAPDDPAERTQWIREALRVVHELQWGVAIESLENVDDIFIRRWIEGCRLSPGWRERFIRSGYEAATRLTPRMGKLRPDDPLSAENVWESVLTHFWSLEGFERRAATRLRPSLWLAALLVLLGFLLQFVGTLMS